MSMNHTAVAAYEAAIATMQQRRLNAALSDQPSNQQSEEGLLALMNNGFSIFSTEDGSLFLEADFEAEPLKARQVAALDRLLLKGFVHEVQGRRGITYYKLGGSEK